MFLIFPSSLKLFSGEGSTTKTGGISGHRKN